MTGTPMHSNVVPLAGLALRCQPDSRLVGLAREGRERAFEEIVRRYRDPLVSFAGAIVPAHRAEDVVQDALAKAHDSLLAGDAEIKLKPWLYTIVRNRALNDLRDQPMHEQLDESFDGVPQPPDVAAGRAELATLISRLRDLPSPQREALIRRELEGRSHEEIARSLDVTPGAVRGLIFRARTALRDVAGILVPMPLVRAFVECEPLGAGAAGAGMGGATVGLAAGGGGGVAAKAGATLVVAVLAFGSGVALRHRGERNEPVTVASAGKHHHGSSARLASLERRSLEGAAIRAWDSRSGEDSQGSEGSRGSDDPDGSSGEGSDDSGPSGDGSGEGTSGGDGGSDEGGGITTDTSGDGGTSGTSGDGGTSGSSNEGPGDGGTVTSSDGGTSGSDGGDVTATSSDGGDVTVMSSDGGDLLRSVGDDEVYSGR